MRADAVRSTELPTEGPWRLERKCADTGPSGEVFWVAREDESDTSNKRRVAESSLTHDTTHAGTRPAPSSMLRIWCELRGIALPPACLQAPCIQALARQNGWDTVASCRAGR